LDVPDYSRCSYCRADDFAKRYGITLEQHAQMAANQHHRCAICSRQFEARGSGRACLQIDHDHASKQVRELLCGFCNGGLGLFDDDVGRLRAAAAYLSFWLSIA
jgi:hypothetical protein